MASLGGSGSRDFTRQEARWQTRQGLTLGGLDSTLTCVAVGQLLKSYDPVHSHVPVHGTASCQGSWAPPMPSPLHLCVRGEEGERQASKLEGTDL